MTDVDLISGLHELCENANVHLAAILREAAIRLTELTTPVPPPPGSVAVRIAVAVARGQKGLMVQAVAIDALTRESEAITDAHEGMGSIEALGIVTAHIPPRAVPVVAGEIEPWQFDSEPTS